MNTTVREGRTALAVTVLLIVTLTVPTLLFGGADFAAGQQGQPSPTGTAPAIQLLNPSDYYSFSSEMAGPQMSDKDTSDADNALEYHFTAVVSNPPPQPFVEFLMIQGDQTINLGPASFNQSLGAWELVRDIPDVFAEGPDPLAPADPEGVGEAVVRAVLFANNGQTEVARDNQDVVLNQKERGSDDPLERGEADPEKAAETVEILYPSHGGRFGMYTRPSGTTAGIVDVEWSAGTDEIQLKYTLSPPDADPTWKQCNAGEPTTASNTESSALDGVRCTLADGDRPESVTGVAAIAMDLESMFPAGEGAALRPNSGDAHRAEGFQQVPGIVQVTSETLPASKVNDCTPFLSVRVL
ncbi:MAG: hypothetical protein M3273_05395, partial [Actinomycetota bacterium]|nr:hypothetical protein [Actinomycetota bacterium]